MQGQDHATYHLALTGGYPVNRAIVIVEDGVPEIAAFITIDDGRVLRLNLDAAGAVAIDTEGFTFLTFGADTLRLIGHLAEDGRDLAADLARCWDNDRETWVGYGHMVTHPRPIDLHETLA